MRNLRVKKVIPDAEAAALAGTFLDENCYDHFINEDYIVEDETGKPLLIFIKAAHPSNYCSWAYEALKGVAAKSENRGIAGGKVDESKILPARHGRIVKSEDGTRYKYYKRNGLLTNTQYANQVNSGVIGFYDRYPRIPYCRQTSFNAKQASQFRRALPLIKSVNEITLPIAS